MLITFLFSFYLEFLLNVDYIDKAACPHIFHLKTKSMYIYLEKISLTTTM